MKGCGCLVVLFVFCLFMGVTAISMGVGAAYPPINSIAKPVVCPNGELTYQQSVSRVRQVSKPGRANLLSASWTCEDPPGTKNPVQYISLIAGPVHGLILFVVLVPFALLAGRRKWVVRGARR
jgi:hypothetical protein